MLSTFLLKTPSLIKGKRIAELGAGAALPSIVSALGGAEWVTVTDYPDEALIQNMAYNLDCNLGESRDRAVSIVSTIKDGLTAGARMGSQCRPAVGACTGEIRSVVPLRPGL